MGIRIHKFLGYGLADLQYERYRLTDPRINQESPLFVDPWAIEVEDYLAWLKERYANNESSDRNFDLWIVGEDRGDRKKRNMYDTIAYQSEYGMANVLVLRPLAMDDWSRYDDTIDYIEETYLYKGDEPQANHVELLPHGIYPFSGSYMNARTGERLPSDVMDWVRIQSHIRSGGKPEISCEALDTMAQLFGFADASEAEESIVPTVPVEIRDLAEFGQLFSSDDVWRQLRPMLYTYWS